MNNAPEAMAEALKRFTDEIPTGWDDDQHPFSDEVNQAYQALAAYEKQKDTHVWVPRSGWLPISAAKDNDMVVAVQISPVGNLIQKHTYGRFLNGEVWDSDGNDWNGFTHCVIIPPLDMISAAEVKG